ncbi:MAG: class I SAM-dependent methyltransferase, partial [Microlunatus sp.]|nr:class I SAM-dependent methyltransferase [Microlunatus sp.]
RRFTLSAGPAEVLTDERSLLYLAPLARMFAASGGQMPALLEAYRTGGGVSWQQFGVEARESQADLNRPWFDQLPAAFADIEDLHRVLSRAGARIADVGAGAGWSAIALAQAYPHLRVDGYDTDDPSVELARRNAATAGVEDRVRFHAADGGGLAVDGPFDAVFAYECLHDMPRPVEVLTAMRAAVADGGPVVIMDEAVDGAFASPGNDIEKIMYGFSLFVCLPDGLSHRPSEATGTVMRLPILRAYAQAAGFTDVTTLPITDFGFWRFYRLTG